jgi:hypothetical protein
VKARPLSFAVLVLALCPLALGQRGPSTQEERQKYLKIVKALEAAPLGSGVDSKDIAWALQWIDEVPDVQVATCGGPVTLGLLRSQKKIAHELIARSTLAMGAYNVAHPEFGPESAQQQQAGLESIAKAYEADIKQHPNDHIRAMDDLLEKKKAGQIGELAAREVANCGGQKQSTRYQR